VVCRQRVTILNRRHVRLKGSVVDVIEAEARWATWSSPSPASAPATSARAATCTTTRH